MELINDKKLDYLGEQFNAIKGMTFVQFMEAVEQGVIVVKTPLMEARQIYNMRKQESK